MKKIRLIVMMVLMMVLVPILVMAEPASSVIVPVIDTVVSAVDKVGWSTIMWEVISLMLGILSTVIIALASILLNKYFGIKITSGQEQVLQTFANQAVNYADQRAKVGAINKDNRSQVAVDFMINAVNNSKLKNIAAETAIGYIESQLGISNTAMGKMPDGATLPNASTPTSSP